MIPKQRQANLTFPDMLKTRTDRTIDRQYNKTRLLFIRNELQKTLASQ